MKFQSAMYSRSFTALGKGSYSKKEVQEGHLSSCSLNFRKRFSEEAPSAQHGRVRALQPGGPGSRSQAPQNKCLLPTFLLGIPALTDQTTEPRQGLSVPLVWPREEARRQSERCLTPDPWLLASVAQGKPLRPQSFVFFSLELKNP